VDTSHPRPCFDSKWSEGWLDSFWNRNPTIFRNFRTESWLQSRYVHSIGAGVGVSLCLAARETLSRSRPASAGNQQAPTLTRPHKRGAGIESACPESSPAPSMGRAGVGVSLCPAARETLSRSCPASAGDQQAPTLTRPHKRGAGMAGDAPSLSPAPPSSMEAGRGGGEPLPSRARNPV